MNAVILANPAAADRVFVGVALGERARRAAVLGGVDVERVHVVRGPAELAAVRALGGPAIVIRATNQVVMPTLVETLLAARGTRIAMRGVYCGALRVDPADAAALWDALAADFDAGDAAFAQRILAASSSATVDLHSASPFGDAARPGRAGTCDLTGIDRHALASEADVPAATKWLFQFVNKPLLDAPITRFFYRPLARPFTKLFVRLPFTPNVITIASIAIGQIGCLIAAGPGYRIHLFGIFLMAFVSGILDNVDGEVARLRLQSTKLGAALDGVGDDVLRLSLLVALGSHVAPHFPDLPIWWLAIASVGLTFGTFLPMYWYCVGTLHSWNIQNYGVVVSGPPKPVSDTPTLGDRVVRYAMLAARRDFVDVAAFVLAVANLPIIAVVAFAIGSVGGFATVIPAHLRLVRQQRAA